LSLTRGLEGIPYDSFRSEIALARAISFAEELEDACRRIAYENVVDAGGRRSGGNVLGRWSRRSSDGSSLQVQVYYDEQNRTDAAPTGRGRHRVEHRQRRFAFAEAIGIYALVVSIMIGFVF